MESIFNRWEGRYSETVKSALRLGHASQSDLTFLRYFAYLQHLRTEAMAKFQAKAMTDMADFMFEGDAEGKAWATIDPASIPRESLEDFRKTAPFLAHLQDCIVVNQTDLPFVTSDNPAVAVNRFHVQKQRHTYGGSGLINSGYMLVLPISPGVVFVSYDKGIYAAALVGQGLIFARRPKDIEALNALQMIRSAENIYFHDAGKSDYVRNLALSYKGRRPNSWHRWNFAVERSDRSARNSSFYEVVKTPAEMRQGRGLMHLQSISVDPGIWCSLFSFRGKPSFFDTKSGAGLIRSEELWDAQNARRTLPSIRVPRKPL